MDYSSPYCVVLTALNVTHQQYLVYNNQEIQYIALRAAASTDEIHAPRY